MIIRKSIFCLFVFLLVNPIFSQDKHNRIELLQETKVESARKEIEISIRNVDISKFPEMRVIIEAYNKLGEPIDTLTTDNLFVFEKGVPKKVTKVEKIPVVDNVLVDFVFAIDITGSMQTYINQVKDNIADFTTNLTKRGIDYRLGLILFDDDISKVFKPTNKVADFIGWLAPVRAFGGGDEKENALEALDEVTRFRFRPDAVRCVVLITDAPYHQAGEKGMGSTKHTTQSIIEKLIKNDIRVFSIVPPRLKNYELISRSTRGAAFDLDLPFSNILDNFSKQLTNLYILSYRSDEPVIPDSIEIALFNPTDNKLVKKVIPIVELGRKLIIENLLFKTGQFNLPEVIKELDILAEFMINKPNVSIIIEGHTDNVGTEAYNDALSQKRAESVMNYLASKGVDKNRMSIVGYGKRRPIASNKDEFGRQLNRRTEIVIITSQEKNN
ncbi:MAG: OmpA family protein [Ignavibacteria bacterium]|nr:OmpA family protein [Ignavibacteria bacterium]